MRTLTIRALQYLLKKLKKDDILEVHNVCGYKFRVLNPMNMSNIRKVKMFWEDYSRELGMTKENFLHGDNILEDLLEFPEAPSIPLLNKKLVEAHKRAVHLIKSRKAIITQDFQYKPFLMAACTVILIDGEDDIEFDQKAFKKKLELCKENAEIEAFFLRTIKSLEAIITNSQTESDFSKWLPPKNLKTLENGYYQEIGSTIYSNGE